MSPAPTSLAVTVAHASTYLTSPLSTRLAPQLHSLVQSALEASLTSTFLPSWNQEDPTRGAGRRVLTFTPGSVPPRPVYAACQVAQIPWDFWANAIKEEYNLSEFDLCVDPGCVCVRAKSPQSTNNLKGIWASMAISTPVSMTVWSAAQELQKYQLQHEQQQMQYQQQQQQQAESSSPKLAQLQQLRSQAEARSISRMHTPQPTSISLPTSQAKSTPKTLAQRLMEEDDAEDEALFSMLAAEMRAPTWKTPVLETFPSSDLGVDALPPVPSVPQNLYQLQIPSQSSHQRAAFGHSRSSSRSSVASSSFSIYSSASSGGSTSDDAMSSCSSLTSLTSASTAASSTCSLPLAAATAGGVGGAVGATKKNARNRRERVFVDTSKTEVTPYDGGKTTVLTGGVMLGAVPAKNSRAANGRKMPRF